MNTKFKIAIIGAGVNGLYLAWKLAERGYFVKVFEKNEMIKDKVCSGLFSERLIEFIPQSQKLIEKEIKETIIHFPKKTITLNFSKKFYLISHTELNKMLKNLAEEAGAIIEFKNGFSNFKRKGEKYFLNNDLFDKIIGCDGALSSLRKFLSLPEPNYKLGVLSYIKDENTVDSDSNIVETWAYQNNFKFGFISQSEGFIWKIKRKDKIEYGTMGDIFQAKYNFNRFIKENKIIGVKELKARLIPQGLILPFSNDITLSGDAAGLTKPWSGGGIVWGLIANEILLKNFPDFSQYQKEVKRFFLPRIIFSKMAIKMVYFLGFKFPFILPKKVRIESDFLF